MNDFVESNIGIFSNEKHQVRKYFSLLRTKKFQKNILEIENSQRTVQRNFQITFSSLSFFHSNRPSMMPHRFATAATTIPRSMSRLKCQTRTAILN